MTTFCTLNHSLIMTQQRSSVNLKLDMNSAKKSPLLVCVSLFLATERLHFPAHSGQAEPDGGGQLSAAERGDTQRRVPPRHHAPTPGFTGGSARHGGPAHLQTGQRQPWKQGKKHIDDENIM